MYTLTTLYALRARLGLSASETADDARLIYAMGAAAAQIERTTGRRFCPRVAALAHTFTGATQLLLDDDMLELTALTNGDGTSINPNSVIAMPGSTPYSGLLLTDGETFVWDDRKEGAITVTGIWGWHDRWASAWRDTADTVQNNPLSSVATTITVSDADGADSETETPRFQVGHLLKIENEYVRVLAVNTGTNVLTVQRGVCGTTAASHAQNTPIYTYQPPADVAALALRWAAWLYREPDTAAALPDNLLEVLLPLRRVGVKV
jgi:hypothetical protein